ncbi:MAG TPA: phosphotransferase [Lichenihabitans sp.]|jgi:Ser/Thr protein kinase RdoA (MazF antagonist)|nr:phosphotransferase [Lichenihabitans sp.]
MAVEFGDEALAHLTTAIRAALPAWGLPPEADVALLNVSENATFRVDDARGGRAVALRVHRLNYHAAEEIRSEIAWIEALRREAIVETPAPLPGRDGDYLQILVSPSGLPPRHAVAFAFAPGAEPAPDADLPGWFKILGTLTARMHRHTERWTPPERFRRKTWDFDAMFGPRPLWGDWRAGVGLDAAGRALLGRALDLIGARLDRFGRTPERFGLIHADLRLANLLVDGAHLRVIDFDDCGFCWRLYDFAAAVSFFEHEPIVEALRDAWIEGYRTVRALPQEEADEMPVFIAMRRFLLVAWIASHPEVPVARELGAAYTLGAMDMAERLLSDFG